MINAIFTEDVNSVTVSGLTQWDYGQQLHISGITLPDIAEVHFSSCTLYAEAITRFTSKDEQNGGYIADIPNECLREPYDIKAWVYEIDSGQGQTKKEIFMPVFKRSRPKDFVNPPDPAEETLLNEWIEKINENIQDNAEFKEEITASEEQRKTNETARVNAEAARVAAENERVLAENERDTAETARIEAESARASAEQARQTAESARVTAESARVTAENGRVSAESTRVSEWADLKEDIEATIQSGVINDEAPSATTTYSGNKIDSLVNGIIDDNDTTATDSTFSAQKIQSQINLGDYNFYYLWTNSVQTVSGLDFTIEINSDSVTFQDNDIVIALPGYDNDSNKNRVLETGGWIFKSAEVGTKTFTLTAFKKAPPVGAWLSTRILIIRKKGA